MKVLNPILASITVLAMLLAASPAIADVTLKPSVLSSGSGRTVDANGLVNFLREQGVLEVAIERSTRSTLSVRPKFTILSHRSGQLAEATGSEFKTGAGRHPFTKVTNGIFSKLARELARHFGDEFVIASVQTLDPRAAVRFDSSKAGGAVVFEFDDARPVRGEAVNKHKVVVFLRTPIDID